MLGSQISALAVTVVLIAAETSWAFVPLRHHVAIAPSFKQKRLSPLSIMSIDKSSGASEKALRNAYDMWREFYNKGSFNYERFENFKVNYITFLEVNEANERKARQAGRTPPSPIELNEWGDLSFEEYKEMRRTGRPPQPSSAPTTSSSPVSPRREAPPPDTFGPRQAAQTFRSGYNPPSSPIEAPISESNYNSQIRTPMSSTKSVRYDQRTMQQQREIGNFGNRKPVPPSMDPVPYATQSKGANRSLGFSFLDNIAYLQSAVVGGVTGSIAAIPVTVYHYLSYSDYSYTTYAQMSWDLMAAVLQGALFATIYRYSVRQDVQDETLKSRVLWAFIIIKSLVRVEVPPECAGGVSVYGADLPLYCAAPYYIASDSMISELLINGAESFALFGATAKVMDYMLKRKMIRQFP